MSLEVLCPLCNLYAYQNLFKNFARSRSVFKCQSVSICSNKSFHDLDMPFYFTQLSFSNSTLKCVNKLLLTQCLETNYYISDMSN